MKEYLILLLLMISCSSKSQEAKPLSFVGFLGEDKGKVFNKSIALFVEIIRDADTSPIFSERHLTVTDSAGSYRIQIGRGLHPHGNYDSIIWSDGAYYLRIRADNSEETKIQIDERYLLRFPVDLSKEHEQGEVKASDYPTYGIWTLPNSKGRRPRLITIDLTTSYANTAYPANSYPIYRHFEWSDPDQDGSGNAFMISYSDYTANQFWYNSQKLGEISLYPRAFQEISISSTPALISLQMSKPVTVANLSEAYALTGPWKFIYYIEW